MSLYKIPATRLLGNDTGDGKHVIGVHQAPNGIVTLGKVRMVATDVLYNPPTSTSDNPITEDWFGYSIEDTYGRTKSANVRIRFLADLPPVVTPPDDGGGSSDIPDDTATCGLNIKYQGAFSRESAVTTRLKANGWKAQVGDFAIVSYIKYHRGNNDDFLDAGWTKLQFNGIPYAYESGLYSRVLTQADCDLINGAGMLLCTDADAVSIADPYQRQVAGFAFVVRTYLPWEQSYVFFGDYDHYGGNGDWASTTGDVGTAVADYAAYEMYGPSVEFHFVHACDFFVLDNGATKPDPAQRSMIVPAFGPMIDNKWGHSTYSVVQYDMGQHGLNIPVPSYHLTYSLDSFYNRIRLNFPTCN